jgi:LysM repeat protein
MSETNGDQVQILREKMNVNMEEKTLSSDMLALPPRSKVHKAKDEKKKTKVKLKYPLVRLLALLFVLLPVTILGYTYNQNNQSPASNSVSTNKNQSAYKEEISLETNEKKIEEYEVIQPEEDEVENEDGKQKTGEVDIANASQEDTPTLSTQIIEDNYDIVFYTVKKDDTLYSISQYYYSSRSGEDLIKKWNNLNGNEVEHGKVLKIPLKSSK